MSRAMCTGRRRFARTNTHRIGFASRRRVAPSRYIQQIFSTNLHQLSYANDAASLAVDLRSLR